MLSTTLLCRLYEQSLFLLRECWEKLNTRASTKIACRVEMCRARVTFPRGRRFLRSSGMTDCLKSIVARMCDRNLTLFNTKHIKYGNFNKVELFWMKILNFVGRSHQLPRAERETRGRNGAGGTPGHMWGNWGLFGNSATNSKRCGGETWGLDLWCPNSRGKCGDVRAIDRTWAWAACGALTWSLQKWYQDV